MQEDAPLELHIEGPQAEGALGGFAAVGKGFGQDGIKAFTAVLHAFLQFCGLGLDRIIAERGEFRLQCVDLRHQRTNGLYLAVIRRSEDLPRKRSKTQHVFSAYLTSSCEAVALPDPNAFHRRAKWTGRPRRTRPPRDKGEAGHSQRRLGKRPDQE